ncbi:MAG: hypothetical protein Q8R67_02500 [Rhodoferax sp.]|nr:hypothetical protein [Rhodoferax sp.]MDP3650531.1 hypothetical protein [Rhodoferax sp.]
MSYSVSFVDAQGNTVDLSSGTWFPHAGDVITVTTSVTLSYPELAGDEMRVQVLPQGLSIAGMISWTTSGTSVTVTNSNSGVPVDVIVVVMRKGLTL